MNSHQHNEILLDVLQSFGGLMKSVQGFRRELAATQEKLDLIFHNTGAKGNPPEPEAYTIIAIANGRTLPKEELSDIEEENFDVILDLTTHTLKFRKDPVRHTKLEISKPKKIGPHYMRIFAYMLEHPGRVFHSDNIYRAYTSEPEVKEPNTFTKTIGALRKAVGQNDTNGPYIVKKPDWQGVTGRKRGCVYQINPKWHYLVIRQRIEISA